VILDPTQPTRSAAATLIERCAKMDLPCWRCAVDGSLVEEPSVSGVVGIWISSRLVSGMLGAAAAGWRNQDEPTVSELFPGCWLLPIAETRRRKRSGYVVTLALGPEVLKSREFVSICAGAQLDPAVARSQIIPYAIFDQDSVARTHAMLRDAHRDLMQLDEARTTIDGFTTHLTDAYENTELLYRLGRSMNDPSKPENFIGLALDELFETTAFEWLAVRCNENDHLLTEGVAGETFVRRSDAVDEGAIHTGLGRVLDQAETIDRDLILSNLGDLTVKIGPQVIVQPIRRNENVVAYLVAGAKRGEDPQVSSYDTQLLEAAAGYLGTQLENAALYAEQHAMFIGSLRALTSAIDAKDRYTHGHSERVAHLARQLALAYGFSPDEADRVHIAGLVHDVGKIGVPEAVLCKPGRLTPEEFDLIKLHPRIGYDILRGIPAFKDVLPGVLYHHERFDSNGYPEGIGGADIPLIARILCLADTFDAMSSTRSYRPAVERHEVLAEIRDCSGTQFSPELVPLFVGLDFSEYDRMVARSQRDEQTPRAAA